MNYLSTSICWVKPTEIDPVSPYGWRTHPPGQQQAMETSIRRLGIVTPLIVQENECAGEGVYDYILVDGQLRLETAIKLDHDSVPAVILDVDVTEAKCNEIALTTVAMPLLAEHDEARASELLEKAKIDEPLLRGTVEEFIDPSVWELERILTPRQKEKSKKGLLSETVLLLTGSFTVNAPPHIIEDIINKVKEITRDMDGVTIT